MNVNDLYAIGAEPIAFVDYLAVEKVDPERAGADCHRPAPRRRDLQYDHRGRRDSLLARDHKGFDLAGTAIGVMDKDKIVTGEKIRTAMFLWACQATGCTAMAIPWPEG